MWWTSLDRSTLVCGTDLAIIQSLSSVILRILSIAYQQVRMYLTGTEGTSNLEVSEVFKSFDGTFRGPFLEKCISHCTLKIPEIPWNTRKLLLKILIFPTHVLDTFTELFNFPRSSTQEFQVSNNFSNKPMISVNFYARMDWVHGFCASDCGLALWADGDDRIEWFYCDCVLKSWPSVVVINNRYLC